MGERRRVPLPERAYDPVVVLVRPQHPGNLGAICRAMLNFGFTNLRLVNPSCDIDDEEARNRAKHAGSILDSAEIFPSLDAAVSDISFVVGTSGKREGGKKVIFRHFLNPWDLAASLVESGGRCALVFGEEGMGLTTPELESCDVLMTLPTWEGYPICNISHAVALTLYELHRYQLIEQGKSPGVGENIRLTRAISPEIRKLLRQAIGEFAYSLEGDEDKRALVADNIRRTILRGRPLDNEAQRLIGALVEATTALQKLQDDEHWKRGRRKRIEQSES